VTPFRGQREKRPEKWDAGAAFARADLLQWLYLSRMVLVSAILLAVLFVWRQAAPEDTLLATGLFIVALLVTVVSAWHTHVREARPSRVFLYGQVVLDVLLVTGIVHVTGGGVSNFAWLYILVISEGALLLPLPGGVLIGALAAVLYFADIVWGHSATITGSVALQIGLFALVAFATGILGDRLRRAGLALGQVESELRRLRLDTSDIMDTISTGIMTVDAEGQLAYMNPAAERLLGVDAALIVGSPAYPSIEGVAPELAGLLRRSLDRAVTLSRRTAVAHPHGRRVVLGVSTTLREAEGVPTAVTAIFQDITDFERLEALNRRNSRLEAVAELSAAMAHEIRNPLASIRSAVEQFARPNLDSSDRATLTRMVVRESERLSRLLSDFIDFSRVRIAELSPVGIDQLLTECTAVVRRHPDATGRQVRIELDPIPEGLALRGDADLLHRAIFNLLLNAVQFSPEGGEVRIIVDDLGETGAGRRVEVRDPVRIRVRDSGPGVPEEVAGRIFDPFFTTREGGTGLGLSVVHRAIEAHRGAILVDRWEGGGAEFDVYLPGDRESGEEA